VQAGMRSRGYDGLYLAHQERRIRHFHRVLDEYLFGG
jgi:ring hydroxylating enzyme alpha subunit